jgi:Ca-activated chloride channel family protein
MKRSKVASLLTLSASVFLTPAANAAGIIVIDPIVGGVPVVTPVPAVVRPTPGRTGTAVPAPHRPVLTGRVTFGLRLEAADIKVDINDQVAKTYITQTFVNDTDRDLAGTYLFPLPDDTTFSSFSLHIDGKPVEGKILEAQQARQEYEAIVRRMVDPGLLEYADNKTVRARIFPIPKHGTKKVELEYTQLLKAENGLVKYKFPLKTEAEAEPANEVKVNVKLNSKQGLRTIWSPTHTVDTTRSGDHAAKVAYAAKDVNPDKDFMLYYSVSDKEMAANLIAHKASGEDGFYLLTLSPPVETKQAVGRDIVMVADTSGSMAGERMEQNKKALKHFVNSLSDIDRFSIVQFNTDVETFRPQLIAVTAESKKEALAFIDDLEARGGTNIGDALRTGTTILDQASDRPAYLVLMTDGEPTVGETTLAGLMKTVNAKRDIRLFDFGVGYDINTKLLNKLAEAHHGLAQYVEPDESLETALSSFYQKIKSPVLSNVKITYDGMTVKDVYPRDVKDIFAGNQVMMLGRYKQGAPSTVHITGTVNGAPKSFAFPVKFAEAEADHTYLPRLWAMRRIGHLTEVAQENGNNPEVVDEIVALSKRHGIISAYTSFLVTEPGHVMGSTSGGFRRAGGGGGGGGFVSNGTATSSDRFNFAPSTWSAEGASSTVVNGRLMSHASTARGGAAAGGLPPTSMAKWVGKSRDKITWYNAPRELQIIDERPVVIDFREAPMATTGTTAMDDLSLPDGGLYNTASTSRFAKRAAGHTASRVVTYPGYAAMGAGARLEEEKGEKAVRIAKKVGDMKETVALDGAGAANVKVVEGKTFFDRAGIWTDTEFDAAETKPQTITFGSNEYFDLVKNNPGIGKFLAIGRQVIVVFQGKAYKIVMPHDS